MQLGSTHRPRPCARWAWGAPRIEHTPRSSHPARCSAPGTLLQGGFQPSDPLGDAYGCFDASAGWTSDEDSSIARRLDLQRQERGAAADAAPPAPAIVTVLPDHLKRSVLDNALVLVDKPKEWTAMDATLAVKFSVKARKAGHLGTLDPMATGLLIVALNRATELSGAFKGLEKRYTGVIRLGSATTTYDAAGKVTDSLPWRDITGGRPRWGGPGVARVAGCQWRQHLGRRSGIGRLELDRLAPAKGACCCTLAPTP